jgi:hypothetical protein
MITPDQFEAICAQLETSSDGVRRIVPNLFPELDVKQFYRFLEKKDENRQRYARAKEKQMELIADELIEIADNATNDFMTVTKGDIEYETENKELTKRSQLRIDTRKWLLSKLLPKKYGEKIDVTSGGEKLTPPSELRIVIDKVNKDAID